MIIITRKAIVSEDLKFDGFGKKSDFRFESRWGLDFVLDAELQNPPASS
jgi:hypothetical protein